MFVLRRLLPLAALLLIAACQSEPTSYHALRSTAPSAPAVATTAEFAVGLEPITLPAAFDRQAILLQESRTEIDLSVTDAWIEPLDTMITNVVAEDLAGLLGLDQVFYMPTRRLVTLDRIVEVRVVGLTSDPSGEVTLTATWRIFDSHEDLLLTGRTVAVEPFASSGDSVTPLVAAINQAVAQLSLELAEAIRRS